MSVHMSSCKVRASVVKLYRKLNFVNRFRKILTLNLTEILLVGEDLFHADGETDEHDEANSRFSQICESA
jgi:hypothetical protein